MNWKEIVLPRQNLLVKLIYLRKVINNFFCTGTSTGTLGEHSGFVQGVAWDPRGKYLATLSSDRALRVFDADLRKMLAKVTKAKLNKPTGKDFFLNLWSA